MTVATGAVVVDWHAIPGWWSDACAGFYRRCVEEAPPRAHFVEVGCWQGRSAATMALAIRERGADVSFDCVDTWQGTPVEGDAGHHQRLIRDQGLELRAAFERHLSELGVREYANPVAGDSAEAAKGYADGSLDLVFIDGDHRREMVERDCRAWLPKLRYGGLLAGHDADAANVIAGVMAAGVRPERKGQLWWWRKRLPVWVEPGAGILTAGVLLGGHEVERWFGPLIAEEAAEILPRYFEHVESGRHVWGCKGFTADAETIVCPCDQHAGLPERALSRSASRARGEAVFPAFPHGPGGPWPFLLKGWRDPGTSGDHLIGFCGVASRPKARREAIAALLVSGVPVRIVERQRFFGQDVSRGQARAEYLSTMLDCPYQLCVRGVGNYCYRLYETLAAGRVPVLVDTDRALPWADWLPWSEMVALVPDGDLGSIGARIFEHGKLNDPVRQGARNRRLWWDYLSPVGWWREWARRQA